MCFFPPNIICYPSKSNALGSRKILIILHSLHSGLDFITNPFKWKYKPSQVHFKIIDLCAKASNILCNKMKCTERFTEGNVYLAFIKDPLYITLQSPVLCFKENISQGLLHNTHVTSSLLHSNEVHIVL